jgi:cytoskeleton protein RodZ
MDTSSFGARLRGEREAQSVSIEALSDATRITARALQALENEDWSRLPGGVFNRGFIRSIARHLRLDEEALVAAYVSATNDRPRLRTNVIDPPEGHTRVLWLAAGVAILAAALAAGSWAAYRHFRSGPPSHAIHPSAQATFASPNGSAR